MWWGAQPLKCPPCKHEGPSLLPHNTHQKTGAMQHSVLASPGIGEAEAGRSPVLLACQPSHYELQASERPRLKIQGRLCFVCDCTLRLSPGVCLHICAHIDVRAYVPAHVCAHTHIRMHAHPNAHNTLFYNFAPTPTDKVSRSLCPLAVPIHNAQNLINAESSK